MFDDTRRGLNSSDTPLIVRASGTVSELFPCGITSQEGSTTSLVCVLTILQLLRISDFFEKKLFFSQINIQNSGPSLNLDALRPKW